MTLRTITVIECNGCGTLFEQHESPLYMINETASLSGWLCYGLRYHICPSCKDPSITHETQLDESIYSDAIFKFWMIKPLIHPPIQEGQLAKRIVKINKRLAQQHKKYGGKTVKSVTPDQLLDLYMHFYLSPFDDWRAFLPDESPPVSADAEAIISEVLEEGGTLNEVWDEIVKQIAEKGGTSFPSPSQVANQARRS